MAFSIKKQAGLHTINVANTNVIFINNARSDYIATVGPVLGANFSNHQRFVKFSSTVYSGGASAFISYYNGSWKLVYDDGDNTDIVVNSLGGDPNFILPDWGEGLDGIITITTDVTSNLIIKKNTTFKIPRTGS